MAICFTGEKWMNMMINDVLFRWAVSITCSDQPSALTCTEGYTSTIRNLCKPVSLPSWPWNSALRNDKRFSPCSMDICHSFGGAFFLNEFNS